MNIGWILIFSSILLLITIDKVDLLVVVLPLALLLAYLIGCPRHDKNGLTDNLRKG
jgi:hypothetical protein